MPEPVLVRRATAGDLPRVRMLASLDSRRLSGGPYLVAESADEMIAAMSMSNGQIVADPFRRTRDAVALLRLRAEQIAKREHDLAGAGSRRRLKLAAAS